MKKILFSFFLFVTCCAYSQGPIQLISKNYFRAQPFEGRFSSFVTSLQQDPWFTLETYHRRTDSSFFFITGTYKNFNPFRYLPKEIRLVVAEEEIIHVDSLKTHDTIINVQLMGISDTGFVNSKAAEKEFKRFHNNYVARFSSSIHESLDEIGEVYNYFILPLSISPVTIAWGRLATNQYTFTITIRFKLKENIATYIMAPGEF
jgi:hypothetical protein